MPTLNISEFSCLTEASFTLAPVNVIIGPQGSGKSVTTKLFYFFADILSNAIQYAERGDSIDDVKKILSKHFALWFPPSAWGPGRFNITYTADMFTVRVLRRRRNNKLSDEVAITFSEWFYDLYEGILDVFKDVREGGAAGIDDTLNVNAVLDRSYRARDIANRRIIKSLGDEYLAQQTFIPAGRAFFTSIGRLVAGFEQAGSLDPVTIKFAKLFAGIRDRSSRRFNAGQASRLGTDFVERRAMFMDKLFGGSVVFDDETEFVETKDGRKVPFTALSSGQQELLPMWSLMDYFGEVDALRAGRHTASIAPRELVYIEEPEAHLFPSAQSLLMEFLIGSIASERNRRSLIITTHSPYIMGKLNVFLKAGQLSRRKKRNLDINAIIPRECWLNEVNLSALAIQDNQIVDLIDEEGLIDATYLDGVSEDISREFSSLLAIEAEI
ncbi:AAA family ATPase [Sphingomonas hylomeconis]|uniref:AAA family ATPase n=1 Tax=Sphingomonas hylomeconis TaxID=1395958 RepID=A0ABV7SUV8_9SPHN|nr:ATP-binding protein [Sphingomonas hylomeconis]